jgi:hypothetical protein
MLMLVLVAGCGPVAPGSEEPTGGGGQFNGPPPELPEMRQMLVANKDHTFDAAAQKRGCPADQSLGAYVQELFKAGEQGRAPGDVHRVEGGCGGFTTATLPDDPPADSGFWFCRISTYVGDISGTTNWQRELRFRMNRDGKVVDLATLSCPGS